MTRDKLTDAEAQMRIQSQMSLTDKIALADIILDNSGSIVDLQQQIDLGISSHISS
jgi:dephospho-CoA kinase